MLEVGCGHGVLVDLLAGAGASVVAVDRSATMTAAATRRNAAAVDAGRVELLTGPLVAVALTGRFDVVVAVDVRAFWTPPAPEWDVVARVLAPHGRVVVAWSVMTEESAGRARAALGELAAVHGLQVAAEHRTGTRPYPTAAAVLTR